MITREQLTEQLKKDFPTARPGFLDIVASAIYLHASKNNDYNGTKPLFPATVQSLYHDLKRKFGRLYNFLENTDKHMMVSESLEDTALDLGVYAFLMSEKIRENKKEYEENK